MIRIILQKLKGLALSMIKGPQISGKILSCSSSQYSLLEYAKFDKNTKKQHKKNLLENASFKKK